MSEDNIRYISCRIILEIDGEATDEKILGYLKEHLTMEMKEYEEELFFIFINGWEFGKLEKTTENQ